MTLGMIVVQDNPQKVENFEMAARCYVKGLGVGCLMTSLQYTISGVSLKTMQH